MAVTTGIGQEDPDLAVVDLAGGPTVLAGHTHAFVPTLGNTALIDDQDALRVAEVFIDPADQFGPQGEIGPRRLAQEVLGHTHLRGIAAVGVEGNGLGVLIVVGVEQQAAQ